MIKKISSQNVDTELEEIDYIGETYGDGLSQPPLLQQEKKISFAPWHHPVKQIVRDYQWGDATKKLVKDRAEPPGGTLRYFTLPGADLLDVRFLASALDGFQSRIEYFGFNVGYRPEETVQDKQSDTGAYFAAESALRQAGKTTDNALILSDRLEDIAEDGSQAANLLRQQPVFDVVNIDACEHLSYVPEGRHRSLFDAMEALLAHQLRAEKPWLLFLTTRADASLSGMPGLRLQSAINDNLKQHPHEFGEALASCIGCEKKTIAGDLAKSWSGSGDNFLKTFVIGLTKHLLQFFHGQPNLPAEVELISAYAYRVHSSEPDMLSVAFRISPRGLKVQPATAGGTTISGSLELKEALAAVERAKRLWNLELGIEDEEVRSDAISGSVELLSAANYDIVAWREWLAAHRVRPMAVD